MLESLDILIAFTVIMAVASLLITVLVQVVGMLLNLRGRNLLNGVKAAFNAIDPQVLEGAPRLAEYLLTRPTISDHTTIFGHQLKDDANRGKFLPGGTWCPACLRWLNPTDPFPQHLSGAVKPEELFTAIHRLANPSDTGSAAVQVDALTTQARQLLTSLGWKDPKRGSFDEKRQQAEAGIAALDDFLKGMTDGPEKEALLAQKKMAEVLFGDLVRQASASVAQVAQDLEQTFEKFRYWFESGQDRAIQWFTMHTRWVTIAFAVIIASLLQLDAVEIFKKVSGDQALRTKLLGQAKLVTAQAENILAVSPDVLDAAWKAWRQEKAITDWLGAAAADLQKEYDKLEVLQRNETRVGELVRQVKGNDALTPAYLKLLSNKIGEEVRARVDKATTQSKDLVATLEKSGFDLWPTNGVRWHGDDWEKHKADHRWGVLVSVALLSLGAPFWFNLLRTMTNLRSKLAGEIEQQTGGAATVPSPAARNSTSPAASALPALRT